MKKTGKNRVLVEKLYPMVDDGRYPVKRTVGERVEVSADIIADGHDFLRANVLYKKPGSTKWFQTPLSQKDNDSWEGSFMVDKEGHHSFKIEAWVDHFLTWYNGVLKKAEAGQDLKIEILEGADYLRQINIQQNKDLGKLINFFSNKRKYQKAFEMVLSDEFKSIVNENYLKRNPTQSAEVELMVEGKKALFSTWYEFFPRSASGQPGKHGTFKDCERLLPRISSMGFDVLYFPPIHPIGKLHRKGKNNNTNAANNDPGSPWAIGSNEGGHKAIHKELGTLKEFKQLIKKANNYGIDIAMDLAFQCAPDHPYVKQHPKWFKWRPDGSVQYAENPPKKYQDILPLNFESEAWESLWNELKSVVVYWIKQGIEIFRVDNPHTKPIPFWKWLLAEIKLEYHNVIFLAEAFTRPKVMASLAKAGFTQSYTYFTWRISKQELIEYIEELTNSDSRNYFRPNFWPNTPDILPFQLQKEGENTFISRYALAATLSASYGIYGPMYEYFEDKGLKGKEEYFNSEKFELKKHSWKKVTRMTEIITLVNKARNDNPALQNTWNIRFCQIENEQLIAYLKTTYDRSNIILTVVNLDPNNQQSGFVQLPLDLLQLDKKINIKVTDLVTGDTYTWVEEWNYVELDPNAVPFHLFKLIIKESNL